MDMRGAIAINTTHDIESTVPTNGADMGDLESLARGGSDNVPYLDLCSLDSHDYSFLSMCLV